MAKLKIRSADFFVHLRHVICCSDLALELYSFIEAEELKHSWMPGPLRTPLTWLWILKSVASDWAAICHLEQSQVHSGIVSVCWGFTPASGPPPLPIENIWLSL